MTGALLYWCHYLFSVLCCTSTWKASLTFFPSILEITGLQFSSTHRIIRRTRQCLSVLMPRMTKGCAFCLPGRANRSVKLKRNKCTKSFFFFFFCRPRSYVPVLNKWRNLFMMKWAKAVNRKQGQTVLLGKDKKISNSIRYISVKKHFLCVCVGESFAPKP